MKKLFLNLFVNIISVILFCIIFNKLGYSFTIIQIISGFITAIVLAIILSK